MKKRYAILLIILFLYLTSFCYFLVTANNNSFTFKEKKSKIIIFNDNQNLHLTLKYLFSPFILFTSNKYYILNQEEHKEYIRYWKNSPRVIKNKGIKIEIKNNIYELDSKCINESELTDLFSKYKQTQNVNDSGGIYIVSDSNSQIDSIFKIFYLITDFGFFEAFVSIDDNTYFPCELPIPDGKWRNFTVQILPNLSNKMKSQYIILENEFKNFKFKEDYISLKSDNVKSKILTIDELTLELKSLKKSALLGITIDLASSPPNTVEIYNKSFLELLRVCHDLKFENDVRITHGLTVKK